MVKSVTIHLDETEILRINRMLSGNEKYEEAGERTIEKWEQLFDDGFRMVVELSAGKRSYYLSGYLYNADGEIIIYSRYDESRRIDRGYMFHSGENTYIIHLRAAE